MSLRKGQPLVSRGRERKDQLTALMAYLKQVVAFYFDETQWPSLQKADGDSYQKCLPARKAPRDKAATSSMRHGLLAYCLGLA